MSLAQAKVALGRQEAGHEPVVPVLEDKEFRKFQKFIYEAAGISLSDAKKPLVSSRLIRRLRHYELNSFGEYFHLVMRADQAEEFQCLVDLLTTNETYFFREEKHFDLLRTQILPAREAYPYRIWSAASSNGSEPYSLAMLLADELGTAPWEIVATDISQRMLETARKGLYPLEAAEKIAPEYLNKYCRKGVRSQQGMFLIDAALRNKIDFRYLNLNGAWPELGYFDVIFLRNVMIYFDRDTKKELIARIVARLNRGGYLIISHTETLNGIDHGLKFMCPSVYYKN
ncbi:MAG: protein-glutamate O-methyltransferase CheR [Gammaproteobacteria bacterium]|nr:protein-glutamate O-methyltransferase CheR [Gammaproteobacteria bacterium]